MSILCASLCLSLLFLPSAGLLAETLQSALDAAGAGEGYDRLLELQGDEILTGGMTIPVGTRACIRGNGAILDLQTSSIQIQGRGTVLDIDHCVITNGGDPAYGVLQAALNFVGGEGNVVSNTIYMNTVGVRVYSTPPGLVVVKNNVIVLNSRAGLLCQQYYEPMVLYNDCWGNSVDNYLVDCG